MFVASHERSCSMESLITRELDPIQAQPGREASKKNVIVIEDRSTKTDLEFNSIDEYFEVSHSVCVIEYTFSFSIYLNLLMFY
jgi:hypothetical protein